VQQTSTHIVIGSGTTNGSGNLSVTFSGSAAFTSGTSYECTATAQASQPPTTGTTIATATSTGFTLKGANNTAYSFVCVGS
jgi:hypothetical protein